MSDFIKSEERQPTEDGLYAVIYEQGPHVGRTTERYSTSDGWLTGIPDVEIIGWMPLPDFPRWVIEKYSEVA